MGVSSSQWSLRRIHARAPLSRPVTSTFASSLLGISIQYIYIYLQDLIIYIYIYIYVYILYAIQCFASSQSKKKPIFIDLSADKRCWFSAFPPYQWNEWRVSWTSYFCFAFFLGRRVLRVLANTFFFAPSDSFLPSSFTPSDLMTVASGCMVSLNYRYDSQDSRDRPPCANHSRVFLRMFPHDSIGWLPMIPLDDSP